MSTSKIEVVYAALRTLEQEQASPSNDGTPLAIALQTRMGPANVYRNLKYLRDEGRAHILRWTDTNPRAPVWVAGPGEDAKKPAALTKAELKVRHAQRQSQRRKKEVVEVVLGLAQMMTYQCIERARSTPQSWCSPLMEAA